MREKEFTIFAGPNLGPLRSPNRRCLKRTSKCGRSESLDIGLFGYHFRGISPDLTGAPAGSQANTAFYVVSAAVAKISPTTKGVSLCPAFRGSKKTLHLVIHSLLQCRKISARHVGTK